MSEVVDQAKDPIQRHDESGFIHRNATRLLPELVAECERLQENQCTPEKCYGEIARLQEELKITADRAAHNAEQDAAREQILREELDRWQKIAAKAAATANKAIETTDVDWHKMVSEEDIQQAARELGIATSDHIREPTKMMLTEEQQSALEIAIEIYEVAIKKNFESDSVGTILESAGLRHDINVFKAMLTQSRPTWEITEGRRRAIELAQYGFRGFPQDAIDASIAELQAMIEEAK